MKSKLVKIKITDDCEGCGSCENHLPGIHRAVAAWEDGLPANVKNPNFNIEAVEAAQKYCHTGAFRMEDVK